MSAPAAKALAEPVRTMAEVEGWASRAVRAALSSEKRAVERAFRARGRLRVTVEGLASISVRSWWGGGGKREGEWRTAGDAWFGGVHENVLVFGVNG